MSRISRRRLLGTLLATTATAMLPGMARGAAKRPNIVMIVADDHGLDAIGAYGNRKVRTPHIDALAREGLRFTNAFAVTSSCSPSRATILTGRAPHNNGQYGLEHDESHFAAFNDVESLPVMLKASGYRTARIGKFHVAPASVFAFDTVLSEGKANQTVSLARSPVQMAAMTRAFVEASADPFFLYFATDDPHRAFPFEIGDKPNSFGNMAAGYPGIAEVAFRPEDVEVPPFLPDTPQVRAELAAYYQSVARLDQGVGALVAMLKAAGKYDDTLILYLTDNGIAFPTAKTTLYDPGIRVPLIVRQPGGVRAGETCDGMVSLLDLTPTLLEITGAPPAKAADGRSFAALLRDPARGGWDEVYGSHIFHEVEMYYPMRMVRTRRWKLIWNINHEMTFPFAEDLLYASSWAPHRYKETGSFGPRRIATFLHRPRFELYDMQRDPLEKTNLAELPAHRATRDMLVAKLKAFQQRTNDPWFRKWTFQ